MKRFVLLSAISVSIIAASFFAGCSSSDNSTGNNLIAGDTTAADFRIVSDFLGSSISDNVASSIDLTFLLWDSIPGVPTTAREHLHPFASADNNGLVLTDWSYSYGSAAGWHVFTFSAYMVSETDSVNAEGIDSVRFFVDGTPVRYPDSTVDALEIHPHFTIASAVTGSNASSDQGLSIAGLSTDPTQAVTVNGTSSETASLAFVDSSYSCMLDMTNSLSIQNVMAVFEGADCPTSGTMVLSASLDLACAGTGGHTGDSVVVNGGWGLTATFDGDATHMSYTNGTTRWNVVDSCNSNAPCDGPRLDVSSLMKIK